MFALTMLYTQTPAAWPYVWAAVWLGLLGLGFLYLPKRAKTIVGMAVVALVIARVVFAQAVEPPSIDVFFDGIECCDVIWYLFELCWPVWWGIC